MGRKCTAVATVREKHDLLCIEFTDAEFCRQLTPCKSLRSSDVDFSAIGDIVESVHALTSMTTEQYKGTVILNTLFLQPLESVSDSTDGSFRVNDGLGYHACKSPTTLFL